MPSDPSSRQVSDLNPDERDWLEHHRELLAAIVEQEQLDLPEEATILDACDAVVRWWHAQPESERPDANMVVNAVGIGLGDAIADVFEMQWRIIEDESGTSLALWREQPDIVAAPIDSVAKRFADSPDGFVSEFYESLAGDLDQVIGADPQQG
jgi:hypothetical protein